MVMPRGEIPAGTRFYKWTVLRIAPSARSGHAAWLCRCECGRERQVSGSALRRGQSRSCGCKRAPAVNSKARFQPTHGMSGTPEHRAWMQLRGRCKARSGRGHEYYASRGIRVCARWDVGDEGRSGFECFIADMGLKPTPGHSIDRINVDGDYEPANCRWATRSEQMKNRRKWIKKRARCRMIEQR